MTTTWNFQKLLVVLPTKKCLLCFLSLALNPCCPFSRWASLACRPLSLFLCLSLTLSSKFVDMTIYLSLIRQTTRIQKQFPLSVFFFIDSFVVSAYKTPVAIYAISCQNNLELHLGYHTCWLSYLTLVYLWCGRTVGQAVCRCTVKWLPNFLGWVDYLIFFTHGALRELRS